MNSFFHFEIEETVMLKTKILTVVSAVLLVGCVQGVLKGQQLMLMVPLNGRMVLVKRCVFLRRVAR